MQSLRDGPLPIAPITTTAGRIRASTIKKMDTGNCRARQARALDLISFCKLAGCSSSDGRKQPSSISRVFISATWFKRAFFAGGWFKAM